MSLPKSLEDLIASRLAELNLSISDESTISYIESLVAEESFEREVSTFVCCRGVVRIKD